MAFNRIQFQRGMSIPEFLRCFGTGPQCWQALRARVGPRDFAVRAATRLITTWWAMARASCFSATAAGVGFPSSCHF